jgi:uncharacterized protein YpbB
MTLAFSEQLNGKPTYFVKKIILGLVKNNMIDIIEASLWDLAHCESSFKGVFKYIKVHPKIHTIRHDAHNKWKAGKLIHFVINNRTPERYQFAPVIKCISVQYIRIKYWYNNKDEKFNAPSVYINGLELSAESLQTLAINDGFNSTADFFDYFDTDFIGTLIHLTDKKY